MNDVLIKTRFTPALVAATPDDDVQSKNVLARAGAIETTKTLLAASRPPTARVRYDARVAKTNGGTGKQKPAPKPRGAHLRACPFCRELFVDDETETCPECGLVVKDLADLPPSPDAEVLESEESRGRVVAKTPHTEPLPWTHMGRGRAVVLFCAVAGLITFYLPWAVQTVPHVVSYSARNMATIKPFYWSAFTAWLVLFPAALSRRTLLKMVGARVALVFLAAIPGLQALMMLQRQTHVVSHGIDFEFHWTAAIYVTLALSAIASLFAARFGGRLDDVTVAKGSSAGQVLH